MMTAKEAITVLKMVEAHDPTCKEAKDVATEALEKQVPKRYKKCLGSIYVYARCGTCQIVLDYGQKYCDNCGQAIDWSDYHG